MGTSPHCVPSNICIHIEFTTPSLRREYSRVSLCKAGRPKATSERGVMFGRCTTVTVLDQQGVRWRIREGKSCAWKIVQQSQKIYEDTCQVDSIARKSCLENSLKRAEVGRGIKVQPRPACLALIDDCSPRTGGQSHKGQEQPRCSQESWKGSGKTFNLCYCQTVFHCNVLENGIFGQLKCEFT